jgi:hypothetical protein
MSARADRMLPWLRSKSGNADLPLVAAHDVDVGNGLHDRPLQRPLGAGDVGLLRPGQRVGPYDRLLQRLEVEVRQPAEEVAFELSDVGAGQADRGRQLPPARLDEHGGVEQADLRPVALDAPEEDVGLRALPRRGELGTDLVGPLRDVEQEPVDLDPPLRDQ